MSPQEHFDALTASGKLTSIIDPNSLQRPDGRQQFVENAASIGAVMMSMENDEFLSADFLKQLVANPSFLRNITTLDGVDPEGAAVARSYVVSGLNTELARQQRNVAVIEDGLGAEWDGSKYIITRESVMAKDPKMSVQQADGFLAWVAKTYGGNTKSLADGRVPLPEGMGFNPQGLGAAYDRRNSISVIQSALNTLNPIDDSAVVNTIGEAVAQGDVTRAVDVISQRDANMEVSTPEIAEIQQEQLPQIGSEAEPYTIQDEGQYNEIPTGSYYRVSNDPTLRIKRGNN